MLTHQRVKAGRCTACNARVEWIKVYRFDDRGRESYRWKVADVDEVTGKLVDKTDHTHICGEVKP